MKEHPILFSAAMARAILDGRKTRTMRVIKEAPEGDYKAMMVREVVTGDRYARFVTALDEISPVASHSITRCPWNVGDLLWVRETWHTLDIYDEFPPAVVPIGASVWYSADGPLPKRNWSDDRWGKVRQSIFMPRWAARISLEVTGAGIQRVQEITEEEAMAEGAMPGCGNTPDACARDNCRCDVDCPETMTRRGGFMELWDSINGKRKGCSWESNPFCWAITFKRK